jgi:endonuclease/exonuclease/phosphatase family metal-dependent hydrolase
MKIRVLILCLIVGNIAIYAQQIPRIGSLQQLEVCNWNIEWFGKKTLGFGPTDKVLQKNNIANVVIQTQMDLIAFQEVADKAMFDSLLLLLPNYIGVLAPYSVELKTAFLFNKNNFRMAYSRVLAMGSDSFSTGRYPFELALIPLNSVSIDTLFLINIHLKANTGNDSEKQEAYLSRKKSVDWLKAYLDNQSTRKKIMVVGDWNDDYDQSIYNKWPTPIAKLELQSNSRFVFLTKILTQNNIPSTTGYLDFIDHQLASQALLNVCSVKNTSTLDLRQMIADYANTTSDHYPVYSVFNSFSTGLKLQSNQFNQLVFPNPASNWIRIINGIELYSVEIFDCSGKEIECYNIGVYNQYHFDLSNGLYWVKIKTNNGSFFQKLVVQN